MVRWDFSALMVVFVFISGAVWAIDAFFFAPKRRLIQTPGGAKEVATSVNMTPTPILVDYARSFFPVFLIVLILRSFLIEPFRIPSESMMPTLLTGDFIVVNKFSYGIRLPILDTKILQIGDPERGDVVVFRYPKDPSTPYIKRIVGVPGDQVRYYNKTVYINGVESEQSLVGTYEGSGSGAGMTGASHRSEALGNITHEILLDPDPRVRPPREWTVPNGHFFVLGDNRDNSRDSRYWGFVPDENLIGRAFAIWMHWDWGHGLKLGRIGQSIQ
jgi:signal peptidase I